MNFSNSNLAGMDSSFALDTARVPSLRIRSNSSPLSCDCLTACSECSRYVPCGACFAGGGITGSH